MLEKHDDKDLREYMSYFGEGMDYFVWDREGGPYSNNDKLFLREGFVFMIGEDDERLTRLGRFVYRAATDLIVTGLMTLTKKELDDKARLALETEIHKRLGVLWKETGAPHKDDDDHSAPLPAPPKAQKTVAEKREACVQDLLDDLRKFVDAEKTPTHIVEAFKEQMILTLDDLAALAPSP
jgi:hypothetical protein